MKKLVLVLCPLLLCVLLAACAGPSTSAFLLSVQPAETPNQILAGAREPSLRVEKQVYSMEDKEIPYLLKNPDRKATQHSNDSKIGTAGKYGLNNDRM